MKNLLFSLARRWRYFLVVIICCLSVSHSQGYVQIYVDGQAIDWIAVMPDVFKFDVVYTGQSQKSFNVYTVCKVYGYDTFPNPTLYQKPTLFSMYSTPWSNSEYSGHYVAASAKATNSTNQFLPANIAYFGFDWQFSGAGLMHFDVFDTATDRLIDRATIYCGGPPMGVGTFEAFAGGHYSIEPGQTVTFDASDSFDFFEGDFEYKWDIDGLGSWSGEQANVDFRSIRNLGLAEGYHTVNLTMTGYGWWEEWTEEGTVYHSETVVDTATAEIYIIPEPATMLLFGIGGIALARKRRG